MDCVPVTVVMAVKYALKNNLTLDPTAGLVYVKTRNVKVGNDWKKPFDHWLPWNLSPELRSELSLKKPHDPPD